MRFIAIHSNCIFKRLWSSVVFNRSQFKSMQEFSFLIHFTYGWYIYYLIFVTDWVRDRYSTVQFHLARWLALHKLASWCLAPAGTLLKWVHTSSPHFCYTREGPESQNLWFCHSYNVVDMVLDHSYDSTRCFTVVYLTVIDSDCCTLPDILPGH